MIFTQYNKLQYKNIIKPSDLKKNINGSIAIPLDIDTEYKSLSYDILNGKLIDRLIVSVQVKHGLLDDSTLYITQQYKKYLIDTGNTKNINKHKVFEKPDILSQYLTDNDYIVTTTKNTQAHQIKDKCLLVVYAHFALADINHIFNYDITDLYREEKIKFDRGRLTAYNIDLDQIITINGKDFNFQLRIVDTNAICGRQKLEALARITGTELKHKKLLDDYKTKMHLAYIDRYDDFVKYSLDDLKCYQILENHDVLLTKIYNQLGLNKTSSNHKLSMGVIVENILTAKYLKHFKLESPDQIKTPSPNKLMNIKSEARLLSKVFGGRCTNNKPTHITTVDSFINDIDMAGAYARSMQTLDVVQGTPVIAGLKLDTDIKHGITIDRFLKLDLIPRKWVAVIDITELLKYDQDLIPSWFNYNILDSKSGHTKILLREIKNGVITSDILEIINCWSTVHKNDFYKKVRIKAFAYYPKHEKYINRLNREYWQVEHTNDYSFQAVNLGELTIDEYIINRKNNIKGTPLEQLYKLFANTTYGVSVSKHFNTTNVILAHNITAICRCMMYMLEKSLFLFGSITDGQHGELFNIPYFIGNKSQYYARLYRYSRAELAKLKICTFKNFTNVMHMDKLLEKVKQDFNVSLLHDTFKILQYGLTIPQKLEKLDRKGLFDLEIKNTTSLLTTHASANYLVQKNMTDELEYKFRSGQKTDYTSYKYNDDKLIELDTFKDKTPHQLLLENITYNKNNCLVLPVAVKTTMLKTKQYLKSRFYINTKLQPSDPIPVLLTLNYCSLAQFKFNTIDQYLMWVKADQKLKTKYSCSFDIYFINDDRTTINYELMINTLDDMIVNNVTDVIKHLDKHNNVNKYFQVIYDRHNDKAKLKKHLEELTQISIEDKTNDVYKNDDLLPITF